MSKEAESIKPEDVGTISAEDRILVLTDTAMQPAEVVARETFDAAIAEIAKLKTKLEASDRRCVEIFEERRKIADALVERSNQHEDTLRELGHARREADAYRAAFHDLSGRLNQFAVEAAKFAPPKLVYARVKADGSIGPIAGSPLDV
jgi:phosphoribosylaminoimidazole-succinocarboxamide synthase